MENGTDPGDESLSIEQATAAYVKATAPKEAPASQSEEVDEDLGTTDEELQAPDEDAGEEDDGTTEDAGQAEDGEDEAEPDSDQGRFVASNGKVKLPDGTVSTVDDLIKGHLRQRDYTQKTMGLSDERKVVETQSAALKASEQQLEQQRDYVASLVRSIIPPEPDIKLTNPASPDFDLASYAHQKAVRDQWLQHLNYIESEQQRTVKERQAKTTETQQETAEREWNAFLAKAPAFKDQKRVERLGDDIKKYGKEYGFTPEELRGLPLDHRQLDVFRKSIAWDKLQANKAAVQSKTEGRPPVQRGGKRLSPNESRARSASDALDRLKKSGNEADAVAAYLATRKTG